MTSPLKTITLVLFYTLIVILFIKISKFVTDVTVDSIITVSSGFRDTLSLILYFIGVFLAMYISLTLWDKYK